MPIDKTGPVFAAFADRKRIERPTLDCAEAVVQSLVDAAVNASPGLLLGKVQSGKTRTFITALALGFDNGFDLAVVFTKGVKVLTRQTVARISQEFEAASNQDLVQVFEIMSMQDNLPPALVSQKLIIVCKKEDDNINRLHRFLHDIYPSLRQRSCLVVDDEADFASVGYRRDGGVVVSAVIPAQIDRLRQLLHGVKVLQVTATPYSLYLQPQVAPQATGLTQPIKPSFTHLVPSGTDYVGGEVYFEKSQEVGSLEELFHIPVSLAEMEVLRREDRSRFHIENCLADNQIESFRRAVVTFLLGGFIRRRQEQLKGESVLPKYGFIVHSETAKRSHLWQVTLAERIRNELRSNGPDGRQLRELTQIALNDLSDSIHRAEAQRVGVALPMPDIDEAVNGVFDGLDALMVHKVNSESQIAALLNANGELNLLGHYNLFVGGNILDRGVTVPNVIGFYYGRRPATAQQDTVLQHCRMYGYRPFADLTVTRFYTTAGIYASMRMIHEFDKALRAEIEAGRQPEGVYFLRADSRGQVRPCGPQKILASHVETIVAGGQKLILPFRFDVKADHLGQRATDWIDRKLGPDFGGMDELGPRYGLISAHDAAGILEQIRKSLDLSDTDGWDARGHAALLKYLASHGGGSSNVSLCVIRGGNQARIRSDGRFQNYFVYQRQVDAARQNLNGNPGLILVRQTPGAGFKPQPFWWPMILIPAGIHPHIFALN
jgi:hypothetical protein